MDSPRRRDPYAAVALKLKQQEDDTFKTTYLDSYKKLPTSKVSPVITHYYDYYRDVDPAEDNSPYPMARDGVQPIYRKPYQLLKYPGTDREEIVFDNSRTRFEDATLNRGPFDEPLPHRTYIERERDIPESDPRDELQGYRRDPTPRDARPHASERPDERSQMYEQKQAVFCNRCFEKNKCLNRLTCNHLYCDDCIASIPVQDRQFRSSLCYCCEICKALTPDPKIVRLTPDGRKLERFDDMNNFANRRDQLGVAPTL